MENASFQKEIRDQYYDCEDNEMTNYRAMNGENPNSFDTFSWGYARASINALEAVKAMIGSPSSLVARSDTANFLFQKIDERLEKIKESVKEKN